MDDLIPGPLTALWLDGPIKSVEGQDGCLALFARNNNLMRPDLGAAHASARALYHFVLPPALIKNPATFWDHSILIAGAMIAMTAIP